MPWANRRIDEAKNLLFLLLMSPKLNFSDEKFRSKLPETAGLYAISEKNAKAGDFLRAGRTKGAAGLRQRLYQNHLMGNQEGNLRAQLVRDGQCPDMTHAKDWIRQNCTVQFIEIDDDDILSWAEHFLLSILRPKYSD